MMLISEDDRAAMEAHRRRYEALRDAGTQPTRLPPLTLRRTIPPPVNIIHSETLPGGWYTPLRLARGATLRLSTPDGTGAAALMAWNALDPSERLNHADTVKVQWTAALRRGRVLFSDMGRVLLSLTEDTSGAHDALVGGSTAASTLAAFGAGPWRNTRDNLVQGAMKLGLSARDLAPIVTFFAPVSVAEDGRFAWTGARAAGDTVDLRAEMDLLLLVSAAPHPLDPAPAYAPGAIDITVFRGPPPTADDPCRTATPEAARAFENTDRYLAEGDVA